MSIRVHLIDGTYELFRHHFAMPSATSKDGLEVGAMIGVLKSIVQLLADGATHVAVATDHTVESFRNELWAGYKTGDGIEPELEAQFHPLEEALRSLGVAVWPMIEFEADDALATGAKRAAAWTGVEQVLIATPDKDLAQCVDGDKVVQWDRRKNVIYGPDQVREKFGVGPKSIPDYLALVGDTADGFPGLPRWGAKSTATVLARYEHLEAIPTDAKDWDVKVRGGAKLAEILRDQKSDALLFKQLATLRGDVPLGESLTDLEWVGYRDDFRAVCDSLNTASLFARVTALR